MDEATPYYSDDGLASTPDLLAVHKHFDEKVLSEAEKSAAKKGFHSDKLAYLGSPAGFLMEEADRLNADLIVVGSNKRSQLSSLFFGSVGRALAVGAKHSVLIAKQEVAAEGPLTAVLTADHSKYSDQAVHLLAELKPQGIRRLVVLTVLDKQMVGPADEEHIERVRKHMEAHDNAMVELFEAAGIPTEARVIEGELDEVIDEQMHELNADLLIMGAQGHGFLARLFIGSASLKQVVASRHSILLLRPAPKYYVLSRDLDLVSHT